MTKAIDLRGQKLPKNPAQYLAELKIQFTDVRANIKAVMHLPYPADPLLEPELVGLTYYQVGLIKQAQAMGIGAKDALEFFTDRTIGTPAQVNLNVSSDVESYTAFLERIKRTEEGIVDITPEEDLGL